MITILVSFIFIFVFTVFSLIDYGFIPPESPVLVEIIVYILFIISIFKTKFLINSKYNFDFMIIFFYFLVIALSSALSNNNLGLNTLYSLRNYLRFYFLFLSIINLGFSDKQLKVINSVIFLVFIFQIPVQWIKFFSLGVAEDTIGTYSTHGGGLTPTIAIVGFCFSSAYYSIYKRSTFVLFLCFFFILYGILGAKRILLFLYPIVFLTNYYLLFVKKPLNLFNIKHIFGFLLFLFISFLFFISILKFNPTLNPENKVGGSIDVIYALKYSKDYEQNKLSKVSSTGRLETTMTMFRLMSEEGFTRLLIGYGPGTMTKSIFGNSLEYQENLFEIANCYGITGLVHLVSEYGLLSLIPFFIFFIILLYRANKLLRIESDPYWSFFAHGSFSLIITQLCLFIMYNNTPLLNTTISPLLYYIGSLVTIRYYRQKYDGNVTEV